MQGHFSMFLRFQCHTLLIIIKIIKRPFIRCINMARVTTRAPYNVRCSYSGNGWLERPMQPLLPTDVAKCLHSLALSVLLSAGEHPLQTAHHCIQSVRIMLMTTVLGYVTWIWHATKISSRQDIYLISIVILRSVRQCKTEEKTFCGTKFVKTKLQPHCNIWCTFFLRVLCQFEAYKIGVLAADVTMA